jgi:hypothetical protein
MYSPVGIKSILQTENRTDFDAYKNQVVTAQICPLQFSILKTLISGLLAIFLSYSTSAQTTSDTLKSLPEPRVISADDPSQFLTRVEVFNEFQHYDRSGGFNLNQTVLRVVAKIGKRFTSRLDIPYVQNSFPYPQGYSKSGLGDISFRLLGYNIHQAKRSAVTASLEVSLNTAASPAQGTGKNMLIPVLSYSTLLKNNKTILVMVFQQTNSISGDEARQDYSFSKIQGIALHHWNKWLWSVVAPELFIDYINGGTSMILKGRMAFAPTPRLNLWGQVNGGLYGDFIGRYAWGAEVGCRYFMIRQSHAH